MGLGTPPASTPYSCATRPCATLLAGSHAADPIAATARRATATAVPDAPTLDFEIRLIPLAASRVVPDRAARLHSRLMRTAIVTTAEGKFRQTVHIGPHTLVADEPVEAGGSDAGPAPHEWILAGLGACTSMTVKMYADRKGWPLRSVEVAVKGDHVDGDFVLSREIRFVGDGLTDEHRARLLEIANKCPVHKSLTGPIRIETTVSDG